MYRRTTVKKEVNGNVTREDKDLRSVTLSTQTSLYIIFAILILVYVVVLVCEKKQWNVVLFLMLTTYAIIYLFLVYFNRIPFSKPQLHLDLFWSYRVAFDGLSIRQISYAREILLNILVYLPLGMMLVVLISRHSVLYSLLIGLSMSIGTEVLQYISKRGVAELDDVLDNGLGLILGILAIQISRKIMRRAESTKSTKQKNSVISIEEEDIKVAISNNQRNCTDL